ncbi:D-glucuronyl C5-epimerase family protein [Micromonospora sp. BRA006-A]|uniref:D-glucuronyl C5-epimerase family protein n=1 Tax=Micromonospora sp. BRA006-A TaxID=2962860 RepID=UPI00296FB662|nr:D-glucuronyl C5-epimerase family protein [Micromonospora sp. BRA006-A]MDW3847183.1 D-glucuronyl C5-epimerase family protein [Micromonospora sp. BRA006-A]
MRIRLSWRAWVAAVLAVGLTGTPVTGAAAATALPGRSATLTAYARDGYLPRLLPGSVSPTSRRTTVPRTDPLPHDASGVRLFTWQGVLYDHPVVQADWGLDNLNAYQVTGDRFFLDRAIAQARRNLDRKVESRGAWWYSYPFDLPRCTGLVLQAPWYSAMAQGELLSLFVRLYEVTGDATWRTAADRTFLSLTLGPQLGVPWVSWTDTDGYLWLEEYPDSPGVRGERVLNGMIYAFYGVYDYWRITWDSRAVSLMDGTATTVRRYVPATLRVPQWASRYSVGCARSYPSYHQVHTQQMLALHQLTHAGVFAAYADVLRADYPYPPVDGIVWFGPGSHVAYQFDAAGRVVAQKSINLIRFSTATADQRVRVTGRGVHYRMANGVFAGMFVAEDAQNRWLAGKVVEHTYAPTRLLTVEPGTYTGYAYDSRWQVVGSKTVTFPRASGAFISASAWVNGRLSYQVTAGTYLGYWLPAAPGLVLGDAPPLA